MNRTLNYLVLYILRLVTASPSTDNDKHRHPTHPSPAPDIQHPPFHHLTLSKNPIK